ncbi:MAG: SGNH/GDSL hydrolase family protein, partial [Myxococcota bacterium]
SEGLTDEMDEEADGGGEAPGDDVLAASCSGATSSAGEVIGSVDSLQAVGDSILGHNKETSQSIPDFVGSELGVAMVNNAVGGAEMGGPEGIPALYESGTYSHVLVTGGGNDFARDCTQSVLDGIVSADLQSGLMVELLDAIAADGAQSVIVGYYIPQDRETGCELFPELLRRYRELAQTRSDVMYICTLETITPDTPDFYDDPVHPSSDGARAIGQLIATQLQP